MREAQAALHALVGQRGEARVEWRRYDRHVSMLADRTECGRRGAPFGDPVPQGMLRDERLAALAGYPRHATAAPVAQARSGLPVIRGSCILRSLFPRSAPLGAIGSPEMKTISANPAEVKRDWYVVDASGKTLGRLCTELARRLRGKHKTVYTPHVDTGDYLVVVNAAKVAVTGNKRQDKLYHRFTGHVGNLRTSTLENVLATHPERAIEIAVKGMLPKNPLGRAMYRKLKVYAGAEHPHSAQQPQPLEI